MVIRLAMLLLLAGCAAPPGTKAAIPACMWRCTITHYEVNAPQLERLRTDESLRTQSRTQVF